IDKPDFNMNDLVAGFENALGRRLPPIRLPYWLGLLGGYCFDILAFLVRRTFPISSIRVKKFCAQTMFSSDKMLASGFTAPFTLEEALKRTVEFEFGKSKV
ncbi:MAG: UDP-N-acetylglucosamine 4-epimerase, partial [Kiritimatiellae bacterium]|nr:UDP-N-acetylglucosamine 4-epimerase [Kiritimatiellia bacterium]